MSGQTSVGSSHVQNPQIAAAGATALKRPRNPEDSRKNMDIDFDAKERMRNALSILNNHQLLMKYAVENKQVSYQPARGARDRMGKISY